MDKVTIYLRTALFSLGSPDAHLPSGCVVIEGRIVAWPSGAVRVETEALLDDRGNRRSEARLTLVLPWAKIDHILEGTQG